MRSSQSSWCSETCQELDVCSVKTNSTSNNTNTNEYMSEEWIVFLRQSASEVKFCLLYKFQIIKSIKLYSSMNFNQTKLFFGS